MERRGKVSAIHGAIHRNKRGDIEDVRWIHEGSPEGDTRLNENGIMGQSQRASADLLSRGGVDNVVRGDMGKAICDLPCSAHKRRSFGKRRWDSDRIQGGDDWLGKPAIRRLDTP